MSFASAEGRVAEGEAINLTLALDKTCLHSLHVDITLDDRTAIGESG